MPAPQTIDTPCSVDECGKPARKAGLCWGHWKRRMRKKPVFEPLAERGGTDWQRLMRAFENFAEVAERIGVKDSDKVWQRAEWRLEAAIQAYRGRALARQRRRSHAAKTELQAAVIRLGRATRSRR